MSKIIRVTCLLFLFLLFSLSIKAYNIYGKVIIHYKSIGNTYIPQVFREADNVYIITRNTGKDTLLFIKNDKVIESVDINERTGKNTGGIDIIYLSHSINHISFDWKTPGGIYQFRSTSVKWEHKEIINTFICFTFGSDIMYEVILINEK